MENSWNPSVPEAQEFDQACPGGKAHYIVYFKQDTDPTKGHWILEETATGKTTDQGSLRMMMAVARMTPYARRATWAEDTLRFRPKVFDLKFTYGGKEVPPMKLHRVYPPKDPNRKVLTEEEERQAWREVMGHYGKKHPDRDP